MVVIPTRTKRKEVTYVSKSKNPHPVTFANPTGIIGDATYEPDELEIV